MDAREFIQRAKACGTCSHAAMVERRLRCDIGDVDVALTLRSQGAFCPIGLHVLPPAGDPPRPPRNSGHYVRGAGKLVKAGLGVGRAADDVIAERRRICQGCEKFTRTAVFGRCGECGCFVRAKTTLAGESCPIGKWGAVEAASKGDRSGGCAGRTSKADDSHPAVG